ncbi:MAG TPA: hypothetical protein VKW06_14925 [Candidatus Angelobacter sp.]|nr:hypothetical protein [Candidatus Angelobacter sp.]
MKKTLVLVSLLSLFSLAAYAEKMTGYVSDEQCASHQSKAAKATDWVDPKMFESCAQKCAKNGSPVVFVTEDNKVLKFDSDSLKTATEHLGHRVSVDGKVDNGVLKVDKIENIKMEAKTSKDGQEEHMH